MHKMFFNILLHKPDSSVYDFVKDKFPFLTISTKSEWTIYPPGHDSLPEPLETMYSVKFKSHPLFKTPFTEGRLDITAKEIKGYQARPTDFRVWFVFDSKEEAEKAFTILCNMFDSASKSKNIWSKGDRRIAAYCADKIFDYLNAVNFMMLKDELDDDRYKILFQLSALKYQE